MNNQNKLLTPEQIEKIIKAVAMSQFNQSEPLPPETIESIKNVIAIAQSNHSKPVSFENSLKYLTKGREFLENMPPMSVGDYIDKNTDDFVHFEVFFQDLTELAETELKANRSNESYTGWLNKISLLIDGWNVMAVNPFESARNIAIAKYAVAKLAQLKGFIQASRSAPTVPIYSKDSLFAIQDKFEGILWGPGINREDFILYWSIDGPNQTLPILPNKLISFVFLLLELGLIGVKGKEHTNNEIAALFGLKDLNVKISKARKASNSYGEIKKRLKELKLA